MKEKRVRYLLEIITFSLLLLLIGCYNNKEICDNDDVSVIKESLNNDIIQKWAGDSYIIYPYFIEFGINKSFREKLSEREEEAYKKSFFKKINQTNTSFENLKKRTDKLYLKEYCQKLTHLSTTDRSKTVIYFSGISKRLFFIDIYNFLGSPLSDIPENFDFSQKNISSKASFAVILNKEGHIKSVEYIFSSAGL